MITVHVEVLPHLHRTLHAHPAARRQGGRRDQPVDAGRRRSRTSPATLDFVLVMSVNPGLRRSDVHPAQRRQGARGPRALLDARGQPRAASKSTAASMPTNAARARRGGRDDPRRRQRRSSARADPERGHARAARRRAGRRRPRDARCRRSDHARVRVRYAETDQMGVVYYANYFVWFEVARADLLRDARLELSRDGSRPASSLPVIEAHCEYRAAGAVR